MRLSYDECRELFSQHKEEFYEWKRTNMKGHIGDVKDFWRLFRWWCYNVKFRDNEEI